MNARRAQIAIVVGTLLLCFGAVGAFAWDASQAGTIAKGISVGGIDIGGRSTADAARRLRSQVVQPLSRPVSVHFEGHTYTLTPKQLKMHGDIEGMLTEAKRTSRAASLPARLWRYATGGEVHADIQPQVAYSHAAVDDFISGVKSKVDRPARDASVAPGPASVNPVKEQDGVALDENQLRDRIETALQDPIGSRNLALTITRTKPKVTTAQLAANYPTYITIDRGDYKLNFFRNLKLVKTYPIAVGMVGLETPAGLYNIQDKGVNVAWHVPNSPWAGALAGKTIPGGAPDNPIKARWMGIANGAGIHGTDETYSLGHAASHGCIRMAIPDVIELYDQVSVGTPVYVGN